MVDARPYRDKAESLLEGITLAAGDHGDEDMERLIRATMANAYATLALRDAVAGNMVDRFRGQL